MSDDLIRYDILTQEALRGVIRKVLDEIAVAGLPGDHHFFITFDTTHPGVRLSKRMRERYPETMTIVIQHTFWNLETSDTAFEVDLTFNDVRERLRIPWAAVHSFFDPAVKFGLQFEQAETDEGEGELDEAEEHEVLDFKQEEDGSPAEASTDSMDEPAAPPAGKKKSGSRSGKNKQAEETGDTGGEVVSLDAFRKK